jgi:HSP20 family molecular chaperone IbpA
MQAELIHSMHDQVRAIYRALTGEEIGDGVLAPPVDVIATDDAVLIEIALPGVERDAITIERYSDALLVSGVRPVHHDVFGTVFHAEIRRGAFYRAIPLPFPLAAEPRIELVGGVLQIYLTVPTSTRRDGVTGTSTTEHSAQSDQNSAHTGEGHEQDGR